MNPNQQFENLHRACLIAGKPLRSNIVYLDRSRIVARERCPQQRDWEYHFMMEDIYSHRELVPSAPQDRQTFYQINPGIVLKARSVPLVTGSAVHEGIAHMLNVRETQQPFLSVNDAVKVGLSEYDKVLNDRGFGPGTDKNSGTQDWIIQEQKAICEALIRVAGQTIVPQLLASGHEILSVEAERMTWFGESIDHDITFILLTRADVELYDPQNRQLYVINWKTAKEFQERDQDKLSISRQTLGEPFALQQAYSRKDLFPELAHLPDHATVAGVQYIVLVKGRQKYDENRGHDVTYSHLTRAWTALDPVSGKMLYSWKYYHGNSRRQVLTKGSGFFTFESYGGGVQQWIEDLSKGLIIGGEGNPNPFESVIAMPAMCYMHPQRLARWRSQVVYDETDWYIKQASGVPPSQHTEACGAGKWKCQFFRLCHENMSPDCGDYEPRKANHETELDLDSAD